VLVLSARRVSQRVSVLAVVACASYSCQAIISADSYFNPDGVTYLAQYSDLDPPPNQLALTPTGLFFVENDSIWVVATDGSSPPTLVKSFSGTPTSLQFDGVDTIFACGPSGEIFAASAKTLEAGAAPSVPGACLSVSASANTLASATVADAGADSSGPDASLPLTVTIVNRSTGIPHRVAQRSLTTFDITVGSQGYDTYVTALGEVHEFGPGIPTNCRLNFIGETPRPKILPLPSVDGGPVLLVRGRNDLVHLIDPDVECCDALACATAPVASAVQPGPGDFTVMPPYVYWSDQNTIKRQLLSDIHSGANAEVVLSVGDPTSLVSELVLIQERQVVEL
jgi:hypothetical protein